MGMDRHPHQITVMGHIPTLRRAIGDYDGQPLVRIPFLRQRVTVNRDCIRQSFSKILKQSRCSVLRQQKVSKRIRHATT